MFLGGLKIDAKMVPQKVTKMVSKRDPKSEPKSPKWAPKAIPKEGSNKNIEKMMIFSTPTPLWIELWLQRELDFHFLIRCVFGTLLGLILEVFGEPKWRPRPSKSHFKKTSKNDAQHEPTLVPKGVPNWSQNHKK